MIISLNGLDDCGKTTQIKKHNKKVWRHMVRI